ncbi:GAF domain-containing protein [Streptomyces durmitorensis]|uniref:Helix-turn-helix domain-containing protein n=1 Tax=Streptomyces durmitorensis TaxID=319947 RepID=A0ABY4PX11_9ACTN|nr:GAF domain-containing protein [Streptomyces durmitorensis]UQT57980.1 helix-turn-helix domain-containing protein [Streptomyces durmitorensis]
MPRSSDAADREQACAALRELLDLLARDAPAEQFAEPAAAARAAGASGAELTAIDEATQTALRVRRTLNQHQRREAELTALFDTAGDLAALRDLDAVLRAIVHRAKLLLRTDVAYLSLNDPAAGDTYMRVTDGSVSAAFQNLRLGMGEGLGGLVAQTARPYATGDYEVDPRFQHTLTIDSAVLEEGLHAILGVPLRQGTHVIGVLYAADRTARAFTPDEGALLSSLADHAAIAIDSARRMEETRAALVDLNEASRTIRAHSEAMLRAEDAHDRLTDLVLRGGDFTEVATAIGALLRGGTLIHDADGTELARVDADPRTPPAKAVAASRASGRAVPLEGTWVCAVLAGPELLGSIALTGRADLGEADRRLFERAGVVTALLLLLRRSAAEAEDRVRGELLGDLLSLSGTPGRLAARARRLDVDLALPHSVFVAHSEAASRRLLLSSAARAARTRQGLSGLHHEHVVLVLPADDTGSRARTLAAELTQAAGAPVTVGAAGPATGPEALAQAHAEALRCLSALRALGHTGQGADLPDLGFLGVLLGDDTNLDAYVRRTLGPVLDYDTKRGTELVHTLRAYFACGTSQSKAKESLHVHVNTVVQRLDRIGHLLGADWQSPERSLEIQLALRLHAYTRATASP